MSDKIRDGRKQNFFIIDNEILDQHGAELGVYGLAVYAVLVRYANRTGENSYPSYDKIAGMIGASKPKVIETVKRLEKLGLILKEERFDQNGRNTSNLYTIVDIKGMVNTVNPRVNEVNPDSKRGLPSGGKCGLPDQYKDDQYKKEEEIAPSLSSLPASLPTEDPYLKAARAKAVRGNWVDGWQAELNLRLAPNLRVPLVGAIGRVCGLTARMDANDATLREVHGEACWFYEHGYTTPAQIDELYRLYLTDDWRRKNQPRPSLNAFTTFASRAMEEPAGMPIVHDDKPAYLRVKEL